MAIFTLYGVPVRILAVSGSTIDSLARIQGTDEPDWIRVRHLHELKADGGIEEIAAAASRVPQQPLDRDE